MKFIKAIVYSNVWIALGASVYACNSFLCFQKPINNWFILLIFFATFFAYNFERIVKINQFNFQLSERQEWIKQHQKLIRILTLLAFVVSSVLVMFFFTFDDAMFLLPALFIVLLYATFFVNQKFGLRDVPGLKIFLIAAVWGYVLGVFPLVDKLSQKELIYLFADKFSFIFAITIPFDIRDVFKDSVEKKTIPQLLGVNLSKAIAMLFLAISFFIHYHFFEVNQPILFLYFLIVALLILFANPNRKELYFSGLIDGVLVLCLVTFIQPNATSKLSLNAAIALSNCSLVCASDIKPTS